MFERESIPSAPSLIESMRSIGYSFKSAIADLIDNSLSAKSTKIDIWLETESDPYLVIIDNGNGMNEHELQEAMRYGSRNPLEERDEGDLGRFGLGLKSASLSQCRVLTVVSKQNEICSCRSWDIDYVINKGSWSLLGFEDSEFRLLPKLELLDSLESGTYVSLKKFDRVSASTSNLASTLKELMSETQEHLALVFHRFIEQGVSIAINGVEIKGRDPFLKDHRATQHLREHSFAINSERIIVNPYILPHISKLNHYDLELVVSKMELKKDQGFYIYRNKRLIIWGTWFRLVNKDELGKLARVAVDIPNSLDYMWSIDIKKSSANLPDLIKKNLYASVAETIFSSERVHKYRGRKENQEKNTSFVWERLKTRDGFQYKINRELPQIKILTDLLTPNEIQVLEKLLEQLESFFPVQSVYLDAARGLVDESHGEDIKTMFKEVVEQLDYASTNNMDVARLYKSFVSVQPYCNYPELIILLEEELKKYESDSN